MSVIGYVIQCERCSVRMVVTAEAKDSRNCPDCLRTMLLDAISEYQATEDDDHIPPWQVHG